MSLSLDHNHTLNNPTNTSPSKQLYSFPKSPRFPTDKQPICSSAFYQMKRGAFGGRATSFGYGNKVDLARREAVPPVGLYEVKGEKGGRSYSFGKGGKADALVDPEKSAQLPGPGAYNQKILKSVDKFATLAFSFAPRLNTPSQKINIGPGQYNPNTSLNQTGSYFLSQFPSSGCGIIGRSHRQSLNNRSITPGPGTYRNQQKLGLNSTGVYFNSRFKNMEAGKFGRAGRMGQREAAGVPGPGSYQRASEFAVVNKGWARRVHTPAK